MVPWTHWREPRLGRLSTDLTSEFTFFNLVIRLSKVKQSAFFRVSPVVSFLVELLAAATGHSPFSSLQPYWQPRNLLLFQLCSRDRLLSQQHDKVPGRALGLVLLPFWYFRWGKPVVHLINEFGSCLYPMWVDRPRSCNGNNVRLS